MRAHHACACWEMEIVWKNQVFYFSKRLSSGGQNSSPLNGPGIRITFVDRTRGYQHKTHSCQSHMDIV